VPLTPWTHFLAIFLNLSLVAHVVPETMPEMSAAIFLGKKILFSFLILFFKQQWNKNFDLVVLMPFIKSISKLGF
jgi:hypothetical protein